MKFLIFADLHAHKWQRHSKPLLPDGRNPRLMDTVNVLKAIQRGIKKHNVDSVIFLGDLFHQRGEVDVETWNVIVPELRKIGDIVDNEFVLLMGNHDMSMAELPQGDRGVSCTSFQEIIEGRENIKILTQPTREYVGNHYLAFVPYHHDGAEFQRRLWEILSEIDDLNKHNSIKKQVVLFTHIGIREAEAQKGLRLRNALSSDAFTSSQIVGVFSGHYHIPQKLKVGGTPFWYVGATHQQNWGDIGQDRGYIIFDNETFKVKRVNLNCAPKFVSIDTDLAEEYGVKELADEMRGNFVKIKVSSDLSNSMRETMKTAAMLNEPRGVLIESAHVKQEEREDTPVLSGVDGSGIATRYVEMQGFKPKKAANLIKVGNDILDKVRT